MCRTVRLLTFPRVWGMIQASMPSHLDTQRPEFVKVIEHFQKELQSLRTGRASVQIVENIVLVRMGMSASQR